MPRLQKHSLRLFSLLVVTLAAVAIVSGLLLIARPVRGRSTLRPVPSTPVPNGDHAAASSTQADVFTTALPLIFSNYRWSAQNSAFGVQLYAIDPAIVNTTVNIGAGWIRIPLSWGRIEPTNTTPDNYQWPADWESQLAALSARNVEIILTLSGNPSWAAMYPSGPVTRTDVGELAEFMGAAAARYGAPPYNIKYWEIYNEPDNGDEMYAEKGWGYFGNRPDLYVATLKALYPAIKNADPEALLFPNSWTMCCSSAGRIISM